jgi:hypothetical protein
MLVHLHEKFRKAVPNLQGFLGTMVGKKRAEPDHQAGAE